jgi:hypothetical protein
MESTTLELGQGHCGKAKCPHENRQVTVVKYYKGERLMRSRCQTCDPRGWRRAADLLVFP